MSGRNSEILRKDSERDEERSSIEGKIHYSQVKMRISTFFLPALPYNAGMDMDIDGNLDVDVNGNVDQIRGYNVLYDS